MLNATSSRIQYLLSRFNLALQNLGADCCGRHPQRCSYTFNSHSAHNIRAALCGNPCTHLRLARAGNKSTSSSVLISRSWSRSTPRYVNLRNVRLLPPASASAILTTPMYKWDGGLKSCKVQQSKGGCRLVKETLFDKSKGFIARTTLLPGRWIPGSYSWRDSALM